MRLPASKGSLAIDEISRPNLGLSPTEIVALYPGSDPLDWLGDLTATLNDRRFWRALIQDRWLPASNIVVTIERDGIGVRAESLGRSLLIVPFEYSHCWLAAPRQWHAGARIAAGGLLIDGDFVRAEVGHGDPVQTGAVSRSALPTKRLQRSRSYASTMREGRKKAKICERSRVLEGDLRNATLVTVRVHRLPPG